MKKIKLAIIREGKVPHDKRVPLIPSQCKQLSEQFPVDVIVQPSSWRAFKDEEFIAEGITVSEDIKDADILMGIKEVPYHDIVPEKKYMFFSHTIKRQPHNKKLFKSLIEKKITLIDYECLVDRLDNRVIGFGRFAGLVGAYNSMMAYGLKYKMFELKPAHLCHDKKELFKELSKANLPNIKIVVTGSGRVANGACETLGAMGLRKVTPYEFLNYTFREPVYVQLHSQDYFVSKDNSPYSSWEFHNNPEGYRCSFSDRDSYATVTDILIHCTYWDPRSDIMFTTDRMKDPDFRISVIGDVTCDINGSIPSTTRASSIENKFYGYDPISGSEVEAFNRSAITVMAIDNLPCELPRDASDGFGKHLMERVMPDFFNNDSDGLIARATILDKGVIMERFKYLENY